MSKCVLNMSNIYIYTYRYIYIYTIRAYTVCKVDVGSERRCWYQRYYWWTGTMFVVSGRGKRGLPLGRTSVSS